MIAEPQEDQKVKRLDIGGAYVVGFAFNETCDNVLLIHKNRPDFQAGFLNGPGGRIEDVDYEPVEYSNGPLRVQPCQYAMAREFEEETGLRTKPTDWTVFNELVDIRYWSVHFMYTRTNDIWQAEAKTDEPPVVIRVSRILSKTYALVPNVQWLIPMALTMIEGAPYSARRETCQLFRVEERSAR